MKIVKNLWRANLLARERKLVGNDVLRSRRFTGVKLVKSEKLEVRLWVTLLN